MVHMKLSIQKLSSKKSAHADKWAAEMSAVREM